MRPAKRLTDKPINDIEHEVCHDILNRQQIGIKKYGTTVALSNLQPKEWDKHLYQELLDAAVYMRRRMEFHESSEGRYEMLRYAIARIAGDEGFHVFISHMESLMQDYRREGVGNLIDRLQALYAAHHCVVEPVIPTPQTPEALSPDCASPLGISP